MKALSRTNDCFSHCSVFLLLTPVQGHSLWSLKQRAAGGENTHIRLAVYYRAHTDKHTIYLHRQFLAYISLECEKKLKLNSDKYSSCKLHGPRFKPTLCVRQRGKPLNRCTSLINKLHMNTAAPLSFLHLAQRTFSRVENSLGGKQPLALPQAKSPPVSICVYCGYPKLTVTVPQVSETSELKGPSGSQ